MTPVECAGALVVFQIPGIADSVEIVAGDVDLVRPGVVDFAGEAVLALGAQSRLESVVTSVGGVFFLRDAAVTLEGAVGIGIGEACGCAAVGAHVAGVVVAAVAGIAANVHIGGEGIVIDGPLYVL